MRTTPKERDRNTWTWIKAWESQETGLTQNKIQMLETTSSLNKRPSVHPMAEIITCHVFICNLIPNVRQLCFRPIGQNAGNLMKVWVRWSAALWQGTPATLQLWDAPAAILGKVATLSELTILLAPFCLFCRVLVNLLQVLKDIIQGNSKLKGLQFDLLFSGFDGVISSSSANSIFQI